MVIRTFLRATGSIHFDLNSKPVPMEPHQLSMAVLTSFSTFMESFLIQGTYRTLFGAKWLKGRELSDFLGNLSAADVFRVAIVQ